MRIAILANERSWYARDLARAIHDSGHDSLHLNFESLTTEVSSDGVFFTGFGFDTARHSLQDIDAVIVRTMPPGSLEQVVFRMDALARLQAMGVIVVNDPRAIECAVDKYLTTAKLAAAGLPVPRTIVCESADAAMVAFEELGRDAVVKPLFGAEGRGIVRLADDETAFRVFKSLARTDQVIYLQEFIAHDGSDVRVLLLDDQLIGAMKRVSKLDFRTNISQSARAKAHTATDRELNLARRASIATGARIAGVDILYGANGEPYVIEVNAVPGWRALQRVNDVDVASELMAAIVNERRNGSTNVC